MQSSLSQLLADSVNCGSDRAALEARDAFVEFVVKVSFLSENARADLATHLRTLVDSQDEEEAAFTDVASDFVRGRRVHTWEEYEEAQASAEEWRNRCEHANRIAIDLLKGA
jgi:hypothetical protein